MRSLWFRFRQNNSGGRWAGPVNVVVEARSPEEANSLAEASGHVYFDGCSDGQDCDCCGDRWSRQWKNDCEPDGYSVFASRAEAEEGVKCPFGGEDPSVFVPLELEASSDSGND